MPTIMLTEKGKMLAGEYFKSIDEDLLTDRSRAQDLLLRYNALALNDVENKDKILNELLGSVGNNCRIEMFFFCSYGYNIHLGKNFFANIGCTILDSAKIKIGDNVLLGPNVNIYAASRPNNPQKRLEGEEYAKAITIGNNVWIGGNAVILPGVSIGDNTVIGAGSIVTSSIQSNAVASGNPAKVRKRNI